MQAVRCSSGRPRPSRCMRNALGRPRYLTLSSSQLHTLRPLGADHDLSALNGYLLRSRQLYPDIRPKLVEIAANSPLFSPERSLPSSYLLGRMKPSHFAAILQNDFDARYWETEGVWSAPQRTVASRQAEYKAHGDMFVQNITTLILNKYLLGSLPPGCSTNFYKFIDSHPLFRLILAFRLQLYCRREFRLLPPDPRPYRKHMITLQSWATSRIPVTSEEEFHRGTQHLDNLGRHIGDIAFDDPDLKAAVRRVSTVLGARVLTRHISPHAMGADLSASSVISEDIDWFTDICGDIMFLILHRGVKQAEMEFKAKGGVITTTDLENSDATEVSSNEEQPDSTKDYETAADGSTIRQDLSAQEILKIPPYLRKVYRNARRRISTASSKSWDIDITDNTSSSPESSTTSQETAKRSLLLRSTTSPVGSRLFRTRDSLKQRAAGLILLNRILKKKSGTTESATSFPTTLKTDPNASRPVYYGSSPWKYVPSELLSKSNNGEPEEMDAPVGEILDSLKDAKEAYSTPEPVVFGPELWKAPPKPLPPSHPAPWDNFHALSETTGPEPEPTSESTPGPQSTETTPTKPPIHKSSSPPLPIRRIESKPDPTANQPPFSLSTVQNLDAVLQNLAAAKHTGTYKQKLQFIPTPPANDPTTSTNNQNEPRINFHRTHPPPKTPGDFHQLEEELHEANSQPKDPFAVLKSQMRDLFSSIKPRKPSEGTQGEPSHGEKD